MKKELAVGIVGVGNIGSAHTAGIYRGEVPGMCLAALCDIDPDKRKYLSELYPEVPVFPDHTSMIHSGLVDTVIIATPHKFHPTIAEDAFRAGMNVLSEKPAGVDCKSVRSMYETARESGKAFGIMFNQRSDPLFRRAREIVKSGMLGEPKRLVWIITNWYRSQAYYDSGTWRATWNGEGGGVLLNQAPHNLDIWQWIFGMPKRIFATCQVGKYHNITVEDDATILAEYENGATAAFFTTTGEYPGTNRLEISGSLGKIVIEHGTLHFTRLSESERDYCFNAVDRSLPTLTEETYEDRETLDGHTVILRNFAAHILSGEELIAPGFDGIHELTISNAAYLSSWTGKWIELPMDDNDFLTRLNELREKENRQPAKAAKSEVNTDYHNRWKVQW